MPAIGIDLGTTHCRVGVWQNEKVKIILDDQDNREIPCYIAFTDTERLIGSAAKNQVTSNPSNTIFDVKRIIGRKLDDQNIQNSLKHWPFELIRDSGKLKIQVEFRGEKKQFRPAEVTSMILKKVKDTAEGFLGEEVKDAVISVPACFTYSQRQKTKIAAESAGLNVLRIMNEPSAAALAYGLNKNFYTEKNLLIFDLGASKCDVSIISVYNFNDAILFEVKSTAGNPHLGGEDFDSRLVKHFCQEFKRIHNKDIETDPRALKKLRIAAEKAKRTLSSSTEASIEINALCDGIDFYIKISRIIFEYICADLFRSTLDYVQQALVTANLDKKSIHNIIMVGGSTHIPKIQSLLQDFLAVKYLNLSINSYEAVAYGAAVQAALLTDCNKSSILQNILLTDVVTSSLGIATFGGFMTPIIRRNESFPCKETRRFKTSFCNQAGISIRVLEGERNMAMDNKPIQQVVCRGSKLTPNLAPMVDVTFDLDVIGTLRVTIVYVQSDCSKNNIPTLMNFYPSESIKIKTEKDC